MVNKPYGRSEGCDKSNLSIAYISLGLPAHAFTNGIAAAIDTLAPTLRVRGHRVTVLAQAVAEELRMNRCAIWNESGRLVRAVSHILRRVAPRKTKRDYVTQMSILAGIWPLDPNGESKSLKWRSRLNQRFMCQHSSVLICIRLRGPWFLNGAVQGVCGIMASGTVFSTRVKRSELLMP